MKRIAGRKRAASPANYLRSDSRGFLQDDRIYEKDCISFDGSRESVEASPQSEIGGEHGLTVIARVRRTKAHSGWDRLIDFGNGMEKENIVINFQSEMMYEVRGAHGEHEALAVQSTSPTDQGQCGENFQCNENFPNNQWMHISLVHNEEGTASIFWNGRLKARGRMHLPRKVRREKCYVGRSHWADDPLFEGDIADVHVFNYALSDGEVFMCATQRCLPASTRGQPVVSLASAWREVSPWTLLSSLAGPFAMLKHTYGSCGLRGCGGDGRCARSGTSRPSQTANGALHYHVSLSSEAAQGALTQLAGALELHSEQLRGLEQLLHQHEQMGAMREVERIRGAIANSRDAFRRAQAVARMLRYRTRLPTDTRYEATTGQMCQPPQISAAVDPYTGMYHAFAIYELRSGDAAHGSRFHVYVTDLFNMRALLPSWTCWKDNVGSLVISLLQCKAEAEQEVVVLRALHDDTELEAYYERIGFTSCPSAFDDAGLTDSYRTGDMLFTSYGAR